MLTKQKYAYPYLRNIFLIFSRSKKEKKESSDKTIFNILPSCDKAGFDCS